MSVKNLSIDVIRTDGGTQMRAELTSEVYMDYRDKWLAGVEFDPVDVFHDGAAYWLADGFHRFYGAREAKRGSIPCRLHQGTQRDAILFACGANASHGLRRTNADKRRAIEAMLNDDVWVTWADNKIAEQAAVDQSFVSKVRRELRTNLSSPAAKSADAPRVGRDGKKRRPPPQKPKAAKPKPPEDKSGPCIKTGGEHEYDDEACKNCHDPKPGVKQYADTFEPSTFSDGPLNLAAKQAPYDEMLNAITTITKAWNAVTSDERDGVYAVDKKNRVNQILKDLRPPIAQARPHAICDHCEGKGCKKCQNCGWWPRSVVEGLKK